MRTKFYKSISTSIGIICIAFLLASCSKTEITETEVSISDEPLDSVINEPANDSTATEDLAEVTEPKYPMTEVSINNDQFEINGSLTYEGRFWEGNKIEGLLFNSRMVQGIFDDLNPNTAKLFAYPDTNVWDPERNTDEFIAAMAEWKQNGLLAFTLNLQGGSPTGYGNDRNWVNSAFDEDGDLRSAYLVRLQRILNKADELQMVVILGYFYFGQDQLLRDESAVINAVDNITNWILDAGYRNVLIEINNECNLLYDHDILGPDRVHELIYRVQENQRNGFRLSVSTSFTGGVVPTPNVVQASDYILLHGNGVKLPSKILNLVEATIEVEGYTIKPIIINEDDHYNFDMPDNNMVTFTNEYVSWGFFDFRREGENFENGYQSVPVDWGINSDRKRDFFSKLKEITGY